MSAAEVEELLTVPLERDLLNGVAGIDVIRSESVFGLSSITLVFEPGTDLLDARQLVQERLTQAGILPRVAKPPSMLQPLSSRSRVMMIGLSSNQLSAIDMGVLARWTIRPRLLGVPGVANVVIWGHREHQLQVQVDPRRLREHRVSLQQIINTTGNAQLVSPLSFLEASTPGTGGFIDTPNQRLQIRHILPIAQPEKLAEVPVDGVAGEPPPQVNGRPMRLGDVTDVVIDHQPLIGDAVVKGGPGLLLVVEKFPGANTLDVTREVEEALAAMRPGLAGIEIDSTVFRPASFIEEAVANFELAVLIASILLALVLVALHRHWRPVLISLVAVPLSVVAAGLVLALRGETVNSLVLAGLVIAVAVLVDDAVAGVEIVRRRLGSAREGGGDVQAIVRDASLELLRPLGYATLIVVLAVLPVVFLDGRPGDFFGPLALSYALAVLASAGVALTVTPALSALLLRGGRSRSRAPLLGPLKGRSAAVLAPALGRPRQVVLAGALVGLATAVMTPFLGRSFVPSFKERDFLVHVNAAPGTSRQETVRIAGRVARELQAIPGVRNVGVHVGRAVLGDRIVGVNSAQLWVSLDSGADYDESVNRIRTAVHGYPGLDRELVTYSGERIRVVGSLADGKHGEGGDGLDALTGADEPLVVRIYGKDLAYLRTKAQEVRRRVDGIDGVVDPRVEPQAAEPSLQIEPDLAAARRHGIKPGDVRRAAATLAQGIEVGSLFEGQKVFEVLVTGIPEFRHSLTAVRELLVDKPGGGQVPLAAVAAVRIAPTPTAIRRAASSRRIDVVADVRGRSLDQVIEEVEGELRAVSFPLEYHAEVLEDASERDAARTRTLTYVAAALVAILLLLQAAFGSWRLAFAVLVTLPAALSGGVLAASVTDDELSLGAAAALLAVFALAVRWSVVLIDRFDRLRRESGEPAGPELVLGGTQERLAPILATALGTALAVAPFLVLGSVEGFEIARPLAVALLGGLLTCVLYALWVVPALYLLVGSTGEPVADEHEATIDPGLARAT
ncbi:MAG: efflux RND transporter permease subunit [Gaiellaceae bacterium]